jgi:hypothetical protein
MYRATLIPVGFSAHASLILLAILGAGAGLLALAPDLRVPYPILLVLDGLALGFVPGIPHVALRPDVMLVACEGVGLSQPTGRLGWRSHAL